MRKTAFCLLALGLSACAAGPAAGPDAAAKGFRALLLHDDCIGENAAQPDTCLHKRVHQTAFTFGGRAGTTYEVSLRVRGLFEPTRMQSGTAPDPAHPYFYTGGETSTPDYSQWRIDVSSPRQTYTLNNYPAVSHTIYKEDFEARIAVDAGATVTVQAIDGNDRQIDNGAKGHADRQQMFDGVTPTPPDGQMVRLDVVRVQAR